MMLQQQQQQHQGLIGGSNNNNSADSTAAAAAQAQEYSGIGGELGGGAGSGGFSEEERGGGRIDDGERNSGGNRWPRQETLALLKIRSDMDTVFRDSSLKGPLWDEVSRKLAELGYHRSAKKCKEKFENVYKYHKRTKDGRTSKADGKTYRFFDQLEALETTTASAHHPPPPPASTKPFLQVAVPPMPNTNGGSGVNTTAPPQTNAVSSAAAAAASAQVITTVPSVSTMSPMNVTVSHTNVAAAANHPPPPQQQAAQNHGFLFSNANANMSLSNYSTSSSSSTDSEEPVEKRRKRKRKWKDFFGRLMKDVIDKQEELQTKFLDTLEKREQERIAREEAWRVQEMAKMNREHDMLVQERSIAAAKDAAVISFLQKIAEQQQNMPAIPTTPQSQSQPQSAPAPAPALTPPPATQIPFQLTIQPQQAPPPLQTQPQPSGIQQQRHQQPPPPMVPAPVPTVAPISLPPVIKNLELAGKAIVSAAADNGGGDLLSPSPSRWPKAEVQALINLRTTLDVKYQENGPKGPLWEEISSSMKKLGYNRNAKRCKEKWENINKYYKKVKESSKKRPEDSKTCPYFHQLDAIYREKANSGFGSVVPKPENQQAAPIMARPEQQWPPPIEQQRSESAENMDQNDDDEDDDDDEDEAGEYEIVTNKTSTMATSIE